MRSALFISFRSQKKKTPRVRSDLFVLYKSPLSPSTFILLWRTSELRRTALLEKNPFRSLLDFCFFGFFLFLSSLGVVFFGKKPSFFLLFSLENPAFLGLSLDLSRTTSRPPSPSAPLRFGGPRASAPGRVGHRRWSGHRGSPRPTTRSVTPTRTKAGLKGKRKKKRKSKKAKGKKKVFWIFFF